MFSFLCASCKSHDESARIVKVDMQELEALAASVAAQQARAEESRVALQQRQVAEAELCSAELQREERERQMAEAQGRVAETVMSAVAEVERWVKESTHHTAEIKATAMAEERRRNQEKEARVLRVAEEATRSALEARQIVELERAAAQKVVAMPEKHKGCETGGEEYILQETMQNNVSEKAGVHEENEGGDEECMAHKAERAIRGRCHKVEEAVRVLETTERQFAVANFLQQHGFAGVNSLKLGIMGNTFPLHKAAELGNEQLVRMLLLEGAMLEQKNPAGMPAVQVAEKMDKGGSHAAVLPLLVSKPSASRFRVGGA